MKELIMFSILLLNVIIAKGQANLIPNPGFENSTSCPTGFNDGINNIFGQNIINWFNPTYTTPDYFNVCNNSINGIVGVPTNNRGVINAHGGNAYAGIITYWNDIPYPSSNQWREYIETSVQLEGGIKYDVQFYVALSSESGWATKNIGANISDTPLQQQGNNPIILNNPNPPTFHNSNYIISNQWTVLTFPYTPPSTGTYYLTIGDFSQISVSSPNNTPQSTNNNSKDGFAYYYIDDVSITATGCCPDNLIIKNHTFSSQQVIAATNTITVGSNVTIQSGANVNFIAGSQIFFNPGFSGTSFTAQIGPCPSIFQHKSIDQFPNVITPNGDGINDEICLNTYGGKNYSVQIFNRWGTLIYSANGTITTEPLCIWDGSCNQPFPACNGNSLSDGTYYGVLKIIGCDFPDEPFTQTISLFDSNVRLANPYSTNKINSIYTTLNVFPNPSSDLITVTFPLYKSPSTIEIFDSFGNRIVYRNVLPTSSIKMDMKDYSKGVYYLKFINKNEVFVKKIILN